MIEVAQGTLGSGVKFRLLVSEPVTAEDLRNLGNLFHGGAIKVEEALESDDNGEAPRE